MIKLRLCMYPTFKVSTKKDRCLCIRVAEEFVRTGMTRAIKWEPNQAQAGLFICSLGRERGHE